MKELETDAKEFEKIVKDILKSSIVGVKNEDVQQSGFSILLELLDAIKENDYETYKIILKKIPKKVWFFEILPEIDRDSLVTESDEIDKEKLLEILTNKEILSTFEKSIKKNRFEAPEEIIEKIDSLELKDLVYILRNFIET